MNNLTELACASSPNTFWTNRKCYYKYNSYYSRVSWYSFLSNCGPSSLPSYDDLKEFSRWFDNLVKFWIGLRCGWWSWHNMGRFPGYFQDSSVRYRVELERILCVNDYAFCLGV